MLLKIRTLLKKKLDRILLFSIFSFLFFMVLGVIVFYFHYLHNPEGAHKPWSSDDGILIFTIFSALFAGFNVLAFIALTFAIERQNSDRERNIAFYDALRFKLQQQKNINAQLDELITRYTAYDAFFGKITSLHELKEAEKKILQDVFTLRTIGGLQKKDEKSNVDKKVNLFFQIIDADLNEAILFMESCNHFLDQYAKPDLFIAAKFPKQMQDYYTNESKYIAPALYAIKEGVELDIQRTLFHSLGLIDDSQKIIELDEDSLRYKNQQRREQQSE